MTYPARLSEGSSPLIHMMLLVGAPERILALRLALSSAVGPSSVVLDAGCGSLGVLAIMAAQLGARRVVAVDRGRLDAAWALAEENGVADRIEFRQCDLADLPAATGSFDVILGMIYHNEPRRDLAQQQLMAGLATRFAHPGTAPGRLDTTTWRQELKFGDLLIRDTATTHPSPGPTMSSPVTPQSSPSLAAGATPSPSPCAATTAPNPSSDTATGKQQTGRCKPGPAFRTQHAASLDAAVMLPPFVIWDEGTTLGHRLGILLTSRAPPAPTWAANGTVILT
jgi:SAM-dependent methyltransferase